MHTWAPVDLPRLEGSGPPLRLYDTCHRRDPGDRARAHRPDVRLRDHPLRRHPPRPRRDLPGLRPGQPGTGGTPATTCSTSRTSPTSTTRCSSGPPATRPTGWSSACARPRCSVRTWRRCGWCRRRTTSARSRPWRDRRAGRQAAGRGRGLPARRPRPGRLLRQRGTGQFGYECRLRRGDDAPAVSRARRRPGPGRQAQRARTRCCGAAREGEPSWERDSGRAGPGWHIECAAIALNRLGMPFDVRAAAPT